MGVDCVGRHRCEPDWYPTELGQDWTCPECGREYRAARLGDNPFHTPERLARMGVTADHLGWRS